MGIPYHILIVATPVRQTLKVTLASDNERCQALTMTEFEVNPLLHCKNWQTLVYVPAGNEAFYDSNDFTHECDWVAAMCGRHSLQPIKNTLILLEQDTCSIAHKYI